MSEAVEFSTKKSKPIKIDGEIYQLRKPSAIEHRQIAKRIRDASDDLEYIDIMVDVLSDLGIVRSVVEVLDIETMSELVEIVMPAKKK